MGLVPFGLYALWRVPVRTWLASTGGMLSAATMIVLALFYGARAFPGEGGVVPELAKRALPLALFLAIELGAFYACIAFWIRQATVREKHVAAITLVALLCFPLIQYGAYNDWLMRASIPALFTVWILFLRAMQDRRVYVAACVVWLIGSAVAVAEIGMSGRNARIVLDNLDTVDTVAQMKIDPNLVRQYYGARDSFFFRRIAPLD